MEKIRKISVPIMPNIMVNSSQNCKLVNIVWIERGILLCLMYYIIKHYKTIFVKNLIVEPVQYRRFLRLIFPKLIIKKYNEHDNNRDNFYFNIRRLLKKQDVFIDYIRNHFDILRRELK